MLLQMGIHTSLEMESTSMSYNYRAAAARILLRVLNGQSLERTLSLAQESTDKELIFECCYGIARNYYSLSETLNDLLRRKLRHQDRVLWCLLLVGAYQLRHMHTPAHAAIHETVAATRALKKPWATSFINAVLRKFDVNASPKSDTAKFDVPVWLLRTIRESYSNQSTAILETMKTRAPMTLRINPRVSDGISFANVLSSQDIAFRQGSLKETFILDRPISAHRLPGYEDGVFSVQDEAAQRVAHLIELRYFDHVLDACAAPGNKALHLLQRFPNANLQAIDIEPKRTEWLVDESARLGIAVDIKQGDATRADWWDGEYFQWILVDAPCTGTGTLRRHPDIKLHISPSNVRELHALQIKIIRNLWRMLAAGGKLLYCTCSILPAENDEVVKIFCNETDDAIIEPIDVAWGYATPFGRQSLPEKDGPDGFYYALLRKIR